ncbi:MAG: phasin family protein [Thermovenabulum sp.]|uniref:phasin family protein n=1 Tax=Thermovenabulum sp. TaxID=3100335 RepID=UPI003C7C886F
MLKDLFTTGLYAGIGLIALTKEKAEEIIQELVKKGEVSKEEGKDLLKNLVDKIDQEKRRLQQKIDEQIELAIKNMNLVRKQEMDELKLKIEELERKIEELKKEA